MFTFILFILGAICFAISQFLESKLITDTFEQPILGMVSTILFYFGVALLLISILRFMGLI